MKLYRYVDVLFDQIGVRLQCHEHEVLKETPCGYWINEFMYSSGCRKWISKTSRKRFAYPTKEEALRSFVARKKHQICIYKHRLDRAQQALYLAEREAPLQKANDMLTIV